MKMEIKDNKVIMDAFDRVGNTQEVIMELEKIRSIYMRNRSRDGCRDIFPSYMIYFQYEDICYHQDNPHLGEALLKIKQLFETNFFIDVKPPEYEDDMIIDLIGKSFIDEEEKKDLAIKIVDKVRKMDLKELCKLETLIQKYFKYFEDEF